MSWPCHAPLFELKAGCGEPSLVAARQAFLQGIRGDLTSVLVETREAAPPETARTRALRLEVESLETQAGSLEARLAACKEEVQQLRDKQDMLQPVARHGPPASQQQSGGLDFSAGEAFIAPPLGTVTYAAVSTSGRFLALAGESGAALCEPYCEGFRRVAKWSSRSRVSWLGFLDEGEHPELLLVEGPLCLGWAPFESADAMSGEAGGSEGIFLRFGSSTGGCITAANRGHQIRRGATARELVAICTEAGVAEVWDLALQDDETLPSLLFSTASSTDATSRSMAHAAVFVDNASLVVVAITELCGQAAGHTAMLFVYEVASGLCCAALHPTVAPNSELSLAYSGDKLGRAWAVASSSGIVELYSSEESGNALVSVSTAPLQGPPAPSPEDADGTSNEGATELAASPKLVWCCDTLPVLAVAGGTGAVLLFLFEASTRALVLQARLPAAGTERPRALAWAPGLGALVAASTHEFRFWLVSADRLSSGQEAALVTESREARAPDAACGEAMLKRLDVGGEEDAEMPTEDVDDGPEEDGDMLGPEAFGGSLLFGEDEAVALDIGQLQ